MNNKMTAILASALLGLTVAGCAGPNLSGESYSRHEVRRVQTVDYGIVESARLVVIEGRHDGVVGTGAGAVIGGIAGRQVGGGSGKDIMTVVGAVAGGVAGQRIEQGMTRKQGQEVTVRLETGELISVVQEVNAQGPVLQPGDRVRVLHQRGATRIVRY